MGDEGFSYPAAPGRPGSGSVSASEVTSGAGAAVVDSTSTGAGICTSGRIAIRCGEALDVVPPVDSVNADSGSLGMELARLGAGSAFGLGGSGGDLGLLSEPLRGFNDDQLNADFTLSFSEGRRPLSAAEDSGVSSLDPVRCGSGSIDSAAAVVAGACGDDIRPPITPVVAGTLVSVVSCGAGDPANRGTSLSP